MKVLEVLGEFEAPSWLSVTQSDSASKWIPENRKRRRQEQTLVIEWRTPPVLNMEEADSSCTFAQNSLNVRPDTILWEAVKPAGFPCSNNWIPLLCASRVPGCFSPHLYSTQQAFTVGGVLQLQIEKQGLREVEGLTKRHTARMWRSCTLNPVGNDVLKLDLFLFYLVWGWYTKISGQNCRIWEGLVIY